MSAGIALVRRPGGRLAQGVVTHIDPIDFEPARE